MGLIDRLDDRKFGIYHRMSGEAINKDAFKRLPPARSRATLSMSSALIREHYPGGRTIEAKVNGYILDRPAFIGDHLQVPGLGRNISPRG